MAVNYKVSIALILMLISAVAIAQEFPLSTEKQRAILGEIHKLSQDISYLKNAIERQRDYEKVVALLELKSILEDQRSNFVRWGDISFLYGHLQSTAKKTIANLYLQGFKDQKELFSKDREYYFAVSARCTTASMERLAERVKLQIDQMEKLTEAAIKFYEREVKKNP